MKQEQINRLTMEQAQRLQEAYSDIIRTYEEINGGPWNCHGISEYYGSRTSLEGIIKHIQDLWTRQQ